MAYAGKHPKISTNYSNIFVLWHTGILRIFCLIESQPKTYFKRSKIRPFFLEVFHFQSSETTKLTSFVSCVYDIQTECLEKINGTNNAYGACDKSICVTRENITIE